jgi:hypothetical protein
MAIIEAVPGEKLTVQHGDIIKVKTDLDFRGPGAQYSFWGSIMSGNTVKCSGWEVIGFTTSTDWVTYHPAVDIPIIDTLEPGTYDIRCYIGEYPDVMAVAYNAVEVLPDSVFDSFAITQYKIQGGSYVNAGTAITIQQGETLTVKCSLRYKGVGISFLFWGNVGAGSTAEISSYAQLAFSASNDWVTYQPAVDIPIPTDLAPGTYDIWCFLQNYPEAGTARVNGVINIEAAPSEFELIQDTVYPFAYIYDGPAEVVTVEYLTEPFTPASWAAQQFADKLEEEIRANGGRPIEVKVWVDVSPLLWRTFKVEVISTPLSGTISAQISNPAGVPKTDVERLMAHYNISEKEARALLARYPIDVLLPPRGTRGLRTNIQAIGAIPLFVQIVIVALAFIGVIVAITVAFKEISETIQHRTGLHEAKQSWSKETMIQCIHDAEEHYNLTPTPDATLQSMSEYDVREYLDDLFDTETAGSGTAVLLLGVGAAVLAAIVAGKALSGKQK